MLINISTDRIIFIDANKRIVLPYGDLEKEIPAFLYGLDFKDHAGELVVVNGPGSFTNLRIVTLALNTYNTLHDFTLDFVDISKIQWYASEFKNQKCKRYCVMYIGQKKNFWVVDLEKTGDTDMKKLHVDHLKEHIATLGDNWFVDELVAEGKETMDAIWGEGKYDMYNFVDMLPVKIDTIKLLEPNYMIEANVS